MLEVEAKLARGAFTLSARFATPLDGVTAVFGPSGAGKSLLLSAIAGLKRIESGRIAVAGRVLDEERMHAAPHARGVGVVFQDARLFPHLSVRGNLAYAEKRAPEGAKRLNLDEAAKRFDIAALLDRPVRNLSGGEKSRVALARALLSAPELLLLDEPFAALDGPRRHAFLAALRALHVDFALPMLVVTHQIEDAAALADYVIGLKAGSVVAAGPLAETTLRPEFQALLDPRDIGAALPASALTRAGAERDGLHWLRADQVLLAASEPTGLSARNIWPGRVIALETRAEGVLARVETAAGTVVARITAEAVRDLALAEDKPVWAIAKAHAF